MYVHAQAVQLLQRCVNYIICLLPTIHLFMSAYVFKELLTILPAIVTGIANNVCVQKDKYNIASFSFGTFGHMLCL